MRLDRIATPVLAAVLAAVPAVSPAADASPSPKAAGAVQSTPLVLIGGHERSRNDAALNAFVSRAGGRDARLLVLTYPSRSTDALCDDYRAAFTRLQVREVTFLHLASRDRADAQAAAAAVDHATGVFFTGGSQFRICELIRGTKLEAAVRRRWEKGMVVGGTSAGAAMMPELMLSAGSSGAPPKASDIEMDPGMGLVRGLVIDTHFSQRGRLGRLLSVAAEHPEALGLGLDENTAVVIEGSRVEVVGEGCVTVIDPAGVRDRRPAARREGAPVAVTGVTVHTLTAGCRLDLLTRSPVVPADPAPAAVGGTN